MLRHLALPLLAVGLLAFAVAHALYVQRPEPETSPPVPPPTTPFGHTVAGAGMVEPNTAASGTATISVGSQVSGAVTRVGASIGQEVKAGALLIELDRRPAEADLKVREGALTVAQAQERVAEADFRQRQDVWERNRRLIHTGAISEEDFIASEQAFRSARGQWELARAQIQQARAQVGQARTTLELLQIQAPVDGTVLQINVRLGEFVSVYGAGQSLVLLGNLHPLHVRVNVDEEDIPRFDLYAPARAKVRGDPRQEEIPLTFVRLEPYVTPKVSLTGINVERVDTRVAQVIYALDPGHRLVQEHKVLVGQLVDVFIETRPTRPAGIYSAGASP